MLLSEHLVAPSLPSPQEKTVVIVRLSKAAKKQYLKCINRDRLSSNMGSAMCTCTLDQPTMGPKDADRVPNPLQKFDGVAQPNLEVSIVSRSTQVSRARLRRLGSPWSRSSVSRLVTNANSAGTPTNAQHSAMLSEWASGCLEVAASNSTEDAIVVAEAAKDEPFVALQLPAAYAEKLQSLSSGHTDERRRSET